ncbi:MAG TPA: hypothetical protein VEO95_08695 [Chthoniobacteraceae bacterium]|nr:hypothetical protein [Chthoniobacteraceae bacterium]
MKLKSTLLITMLALTASAFAQAPDPKAQDPNNNDPNRQRGRFNYDEFRQRMNERLKETLKVTDEEWSVIQPLIDKVQTKLRDATTSRFGGFGGPPRGSSGDSASGSSSGNRPTSDPSRPERAGTAERDALRTAIEKEGASTEELKAKMAAVRDIQKKSQAELAEAREELKKVLTVRQEAALVSFGILD